EHCHDRHVHMSKNTPAVRIVTIPMEPAIEESARFTSQPARSSPIIFTSRLPAVTSGEPMDRGSTRPGRASGRVM
ncbi:MAG TPA: hypothetical protein PLY66_00485, partial [Acidobacteriota bacterium]|nr:hypothetical protein [Acidobacteriota bacterium]